MPRKLSKLSDDYTKLVETIAEKLQQDGHDITVEKVEQIITAYNRLLKEAKHRHSATR
jgi:hypothetical protein